MGRSGGMCVGPAPPPLPSLCPHPGPQPLNVCGSFPEHRACWDGPRSLLGRRRRRLSVPPLTTISQPPGGLSFSPRAPDVKRSSRHVLATTGVLEALPALSAIPQKSARNGVGSRTESLPPCASQTVDPCPARSQGQGAPPRRALEGRACVDEEDRGPR